MRSPLVPHHVRRTTPHDGAMLAALAALVQEAHRAHAALLPAVFQPGEATVLTTGELAGLVAAPEQRWWLATADDGRAVGFLQAEVQRVPASRHKRAAARLHVVAMGVARVARRGGVGRALLAAARAEALTEALGEVTLEVYAANAAARALYAAEGFHPLRTLLRWTPADGTSAPPGDVRADVRADLRADLRADASVEASVEAKATVAVASVAPGPADAPTLDAVHPVLAARDVGASVAFYARLGFTPVYRDHATEPRYAVVRRDAVELHLQWADATQWAPGIDRPAYRFPTRNVDALHAALLATLGTRDDMRGDAIADASDHARTEAPAVTVDGAGGPTSGARSGEPAGLLPGAAGPYARPASTPWGTREFHLRDPGGNVLQFYAPRPAADVAAR